MQSMEMKTPLYTDLVQYVQRWYNTVVLCISGIYSRFVLVLRSRAACATWTLTNLQITVFESSSMMQWLNVREQRMSQSPLDRIRRGNLIGEYWPCLYLYTVASQLQDSPKSPETCLALTTLAKCLSIN